MAGRPDQRHRAIVMIAVVAAVVVLAFGASPAGAQTSPAPAPGPAPAPTGPPAPTDTPAGPTVRTGIDETARQAALGEVNGAQLTLKDAQKLEADLKRKAASIDQALTDLTNKRASMAAEEQRIAGELESARSRIRATAVSEYITGGNLTIANILLNQGTPESYGRSRVYGLNVASTHKKAVVQFRETLTQATGATIEISKQIDRGTADRGQVHLQIEAASKVRAQREAELNQKTQLSNLVSAAASVLPSDIPLLFLNAYIRGAAAANRRAPACNVHWSVLAGIGRIESGHGRTGGAGVTIGGDVVPRILGPRLDGTRFARITDTDGGYYDGDVEFDRATGPMQFIPSTWKVMAADGNGDGLADPNNIYDAAVAAAMYLCRARQGLDQEANIRTAVFSYNHSEAYVSRVVANMWEYLGMNLQGAPPTTIAPIDPAAVSAQQAGP